MTAAARYLGVDAGNSKTVAVVADESGLVLGYGRAGCGDIYAVPSEQQAVAEVLAAVRAAVAMSGSTIGAGPGDDSRGESSIETAAFCLAGLDWRSDLAFWTEQLRHRLPGLSHGRLLNDGFALLRAGAPDGVGIALSAGTNSAVAARSRHGREWSGSFWVVGPQGGRSLGDAAWTEVIRAELGMAPPTLLRGAVLQRLGHTDVATLLEATTSRGSTPIRFADLARAVLDAARDGDAAAAGIVRGQAESFARYAKAAAELVGMDDPAPRVVLGGSVFSSENPVLRDAAGAAIEALLPGAQPLLTPRSPVVGAVAEAIAQGVGTLSPEVVDRLTGYAFPPEFLLT